MNLSKKIIHISKIRNTRYFVKLDDLKDSLEELQEELKKVQMTVILYKSKEIIKKVFGPKLT